jgi:hypothetical protein
LGCGGGVGTVRGGVGRKTVVRQIGPLISIFNLIKESLFFNKHTSLLSLKPWT